MAPHDLNMTSCFNHSGSALRQSLKSCGQSLILGSILTTMTTTAWLSFGSTAAAIEPTNAPPLPVQSVSRVKPMHSVRSFLASAPGNVIPPLGQAQPFLPDAAVPNAPTELTTRLVLKRGQRRVYVYQGDQAISSYPVAVGKPGWETPLGKFEVLSMEENPIFKSFKSGRVIPPGEDNPLGVRWVGIWTDGKTQLGFHGTNEPELIGQAVSHGCIRMHNKDVTQLFQQVKMGTVVTIVP